MHAAVLRWDTCSTMRPSPRARSVGSVSRCVRKKLVTTTYAYDNNVNLISAGNGTATTTYTYDYANRLTALNAGGATTTYGYDAFGSRVLQIGTSTTYIYPNKWYSIASSAGSGAKYSTTTEYVFNGDSLLATIDRKLASGVATGTAITRYVHPDHLGSTNVVTDENANLVQTLDYYPYGGIRISVATSTNEKRKRDVPLSAELRDRIAELEVRLEAATPPKLKAVK